MKVSEVVYDIKEAIRSLSSDSTFTDRYILQVVDNFRAKYIRQHQARNPGESKRAYTQTLFVSMEEVDVAYDNFSFNLGNTILKSTKKIPSIIGKTFLKDVTVSPIDRISSEITYMDKSRAIFASKISNEIISFLDDDSFLFCNSNNNLFKSLKNLAFTAILENPTDIVEFNELSDRDIEYPIPFHLWSLLKPEILEYFTRIMNIPTDIIQDNKSV